MLQNVLWPIFAIIGIGYALGKSGLLSPRPVGRLTFWVLAPALIFTSLYQSEVRPAVFGQVFLFVLLFSIVMWGIAQLFSRLLQLDHRSGAGVALALILSNCGNYGLPFLLFSLGQGAFDLGIIYLVSQTILIATLGVFIASRGEAFSFKPFLEILKTPWLYVAGAGLAFHQSGLIIPESLIRPLSMLSEAAIPVLLVLLGLQLSQVRLGHRWRAAGWATALRLLGAPLLSWPILALLGIDGLLQTVMILEASTPAAVNALLLALEYDRDPELVSSIVLLTTVASIGTLSGLLLLLR